MRDDERWMHVEAVAGALASSWDQALPEGDVLAMLFLVGLSPEDAAMVLAEGVDRGLLRHRRGEIRLANRANEIERLARLHDAPTPSRRSWSLRPPTGESAAPSQR